MATHKKVKKTLSKSQRESKKREKNNRLAAIILAVLMIASLAGIALSGNSSQSDSSSFTYGDYKFNLQQIEGSTQSVLVTEVNGVDVGFYSLPQDTLRLNVTGNLSFLKDSNYMVFTGNPTDVLMPIQDLLRYEMNQATGKNIGAAVLFENANYTEYPVVTCLNASTVVPVIELVESNITKIDVEGSCVKIQSLPSDILYVRDRLLFQMVGILN